jgi:lipopolysaccharide/colanic/teichoic acid biosynthesis glycosyltransferase
MTLSRMMRQIIGGSVLIALVPINLILAIILWLSQGPSVLFRQERAGVGGGTFRLVKFRTMRELFDQEGNALPDEERVTAVGAFLRKTRLDELPSFWNVARGELAFVGPRPLLPETIKQLGDRGIRRGSVAPGLTGWAQINGNTLLTLDEKVALDLHYIANRRWTTDVYILAMTVWVMAAGEKRKAAVDRASPQ